jgi:hypothetical protein
LLVHTLHYILDLPLETAHLILSFNSLHSNAKVWIAIFREKCSDAKVLEKAEAAFSLVERTTKGRNDFVHAIFAIPKGNMWLLDVVPEDVSHRRSKKGEAIAVRTRDISKKRPITDLMGIRDDAAKLSVILSEIADEFLPVG